jgi:hypothetical protein
MQSLSTKSLNIAFISLVAFALLYWSYRYLNKPKPLPNDPKNMVTLKLETTNCSLMFDSTEISESDAKVVFALLQKVGIYSARVRNAKAIFFKGEGNVYSIMLFVSKKALYSSDADSIAKDMLKELKLNYKNRKYQFFLSADSAGTTLFPRKIQLE